MGDWVASGPREALRRHSPRNSGSQRSRGVASFAAYTPSSRVRPRGTHPVPPALSLYSGAAPLPRKAILPWPASFRTGVSAPQGWTSRDWGLRSEKAPLLAGPLLQWGPCFSPSPKASAWPRGAPGGLGVQMHNSGGSCPVPRPRVPPSRSPIRAPRVGGDGPPPALAPAASAPTQGPDAGPSTAGSPRRPGRRGAALGGPETDSPAPPGRAARASRARERGRRRLTSSGRAGPGRAGLR